MVGQRIASLLIGLHWKPSGAPVPLRIGPGSAPAKARVRPGPVTDRPRIDRKSGPDQLRIGRQSAPDQGPIRGHPEDPGQICDTRPIKGRFGSDVTPIHA